MGGDYGCFMPAKQDNPKDNDTPDHTPVARARDRIARATVAQREEAAKAIAEAKSGLSVAGVLKLAHRALRRAEEVINEVLELVPPPRPIACKANCPWCCHIRLTATPPEVLLVLDYIAETFTAGEVAALKRKVANIDAFTRGLDAEDRARLRLPCPLL